jgi:predicted ATP-grasp superfamily ATP-dependent carboligase
VAGEFDLVGVNGVDFIACDGLPVPIEINPRWSASLELVERSLGASLFGMHVRACANGVVTPAVATPSGLGASGKAVVFARAGCVAHGTRQWLDDPDVRDVPRQGEQIPAGHPICTVFARADTASACYASLVERAERVYERIQASCLAVD